MFQREFWMEIGESLWRHKLRSTLTAFSVFWGMLMLVLLLGSGNGLRRGVEFQFKDDAVNSIWLYPGTTSRPWRGLPTGRDMRFRNAEVEHVRKTEAAEIERVRQEKLFRDGTIAEQAYLQFQLDAEQAQQQLKAAESALEVIRTGAAQGSKTAANLVRATADGMVLDVPVEKGNSVISANNFNEGTTVVSVADMSEMIFEGKVDESEVGKLTEGMALELTIGAVDDRTLPATLDFIAPKGVNEEGTIKFEIRASVQLPEDVFLRAGYSANADIVLDAVDSVLVIKEAWLQFAGDTAYVEVETGDQVFERRDVELGLSDGLVVQLMSGPDSTEAIKVPR
jgi:HlyD family secretion protein